MKTARRVRGVLAGLSQECVPVSRGRGSGCSEPETGSVGAVKGRRCPSLRLKVRARECPTEVCVQRPHPQPLSPRLGTSSLPTPPGSSLLPQPGGPGRALGETGTGSRGSGGGSGEVGASGAQCGVAGKEGGEDRDEGTLARPEGPGVSLLGPGRRTWRRRPLAGPPPRR